MDTYITSSARVPKELYIERRADLQIRRIIRDMARPGYVLVARQMGKTNLLLHTKDLLQDDDNIFVYVDFSTMGDFSERECLNYLIDTAIEINFEKFTEAESQIGKLRNTDGYNPSRMFVRELRILLKYVDKIVFVLDEIDALTRRSYSDRIFSLIRGHYYINTNFPELKRATFILSGVIEPKDIIKDPNISPFNIGEKIYLSDFTFDEFIKLVNNSSYLKGCGSELIGRLYYWSKGQPRISWDICLAAERCQVRTTDDIDKLVYNLYLKSFDRAPIDSIREKIKFDAELRDALIQLSINKGELLSNEVKSKLYLAGIINYNDKIPIFKNPIMKCSLDYDWLISLHGKKMDYISEAEKGIKLEKDYKKAINLLTNFLSAENVNNEDLSKSYYLLALAYHRNFNPKESLIQLDKLSSEAVSSQFYIPKEFLRANNYIALDDYEKAEEILRELVQKAPQTTDRLNILVRIYLCSTLLESDKPEKWKEAETILQTLICDSHNELLRLQLIATVFFYLAGVEEKRQNHKGCVKHIDTALIYAQSNEKPKLLYFKLQHTEDKESCASELYKSLDLIKSKPETEDFENLLVLNTLYACLILANMMLYYPRYDVTKYLRLFLYDSKESAVIFILSILIENEPSLSKEFFNHIEALIDYDEWNFQIGELIALANLQLLEYDKESIAKLILSKFESNNESVPSEAQELYGNLIQRSIKQGNINKALGYVNSFNNVEHRILEIRQAHLISIGYMECIALYRNHDIINAEKKAIGLINLIEEYCSEFKDDTLQISNLKKQSQYKLQLEQMLNHITTTRRSLGLVNFKTSELGRNSKIRIRFKYDGHEEIVKYKQFKKEIDIGICVIVEVL